ncbi:hypothetical protein ABT341_30045, partial [Pseudonocardia alni]
MTLHRRGRPAPGPAAAFVPAPRHPRDGARRALPVGPPDPWDELAHVPPVRPQPDPEPGLTDATPHDLDTDTGAPPSRTTGAHRTAPRSRYR